MTPTTTPCQVCGAVLMAAADTIANELIECGDCGTEFEVTNVEPLTLTEAPLEEEDWGE